MPAKKLVLNLPTLEVWKAELTSVASYITEMIYPPTDGHHPSTNPTVHGWELNSQAVDHESDALTTTSTPPSHPFTVFNVVIMFIHVGSVTKSHQCWLHSYIFVYFNHFTQIRV